MEKSSKYYLLSDIQKHLLHIKKLRFTSMVHKDLVVLNLDLSDVHFVIQHLKPEHFYKSMTTYHDHRLWQDVYHYPYQGKMLYIKIMAHEDSYLIVSFKEK
ncbi:type II toxin-antitoxin system MqsR family toxin [Candidatus Albibeggiatoa sp. nov. NOAA]|uniref:type II toxin-antitoxin system MqsR family toxin n=1 Tax=Candidatus Albibeggiatoa sp. nov. NOAA TaxID=3162724 RepID=UPI00333E4B07